ncbi:hypothetical protein [Aeoliella sp.]|uniref:hypothetical protein n=1 Tax=Aeoliella sp. TaxID=2795800 RepID=UPI003CCB9C7C
MPLRRYTLRRLLSAVTLLCVMLGLVAAFPQTATKQMSSLLPWTVALGIMAWSCAYSRQRLVTFVIIGGAIAVGSVALPAGMDRMIQSVRPSDAED